MSPSHAPFDQSFAHGIYKDKYAWGDEEWPETAKRVPAAVMPALYDAPGARRGEVSWQEIEDATRRITGLITNREFIPGGRYLYAAGRDLHQVQNCLLMRAEDTREGWSELTYKGTMALMTGAGIGVEYSDIRPSGSLISRTGGTASGPLSLMNMINEVGRNVMQGGARRSAIWAGLNWDHPDIFDFIRSKDWPQWLRKQKDKDPTVAAPLDMTNISVGLDRSFFLCFDSPRGGEQRALYAGDAPDGGGWHDWARRVYNLTISKMLTTAEPGFSVNYDNPRENLRNACTEIASEDDSDVCNLGSMNLARFDNIDQFRSAVRDATLFLLAGTLYSDLPYDKVYEIREKNRRLGLGLMGVHEFLLKRGKPYGPDDELAEYLDAYEQESDRAAAQWASRLEISPPIAKRAIAPNGTIGIVGETTTSGEPMLAAAIKRRLRNAAADGDTIQYEYVVDPTAKRLIDQGVDASAIEDAYSLALQPERRIEFQAWLQRWVDQGISSTINLPAPITDPLEQAEFGELLYGYLPKLRGVTCYPDGARGGQPLTPVPIEYALEHAGVRFEETEDRCVGGACGV